MAHRKEKERATTGFGKEGEKRLQWNLGMYAFPMGTAEM